MTESAVRKREESSLPNIRLSLAAVIVCLGGSANFAYHLIITNPAQEAFVDFVNKSFTEKHGSNLSKEQLETVWSLIVSLLYWGTIVGALLIQITSQKLGRKKALIVANGGQAAAVALAVVSYFTTDYILFTVSRFVLGVFQAISLGIGPMYIMECSPSRCRGVISLSTALIMQCFIVIAAVVALPKFWGNGLDWWKLFGAEFVLLVFVIGASQLLPESPPVLQSQGKKTEAQKSLQFYHGLNNQEALELLDADSEDKSTETTAKDQSLFEVLRNEESRRGTVLGCTVMFSMIFSGIVVVNAFAVEILMNTGLSLDAAANANVGICLISIVGVVLASLVVDRMGRRMLVLLGIGALALTNVAVFALMFGFNKTQNAALGWSLVGAVCFFTLVACTTVIPISFFITTELVDARARPAAQTWVNLVLSGSRSILLAVFLPLKLLLGAPLTYLLLFLPPLLFSLVFLYYRLPETKGRDYAQVQKEYERLPGRRRD